VLGSEEPHAVGSEGGGRDVEIGLALLEVDLSLGAEGGVLVAAPAELRIAAPGGLEAEAGEGGGAVLGRSAGAAWVLEGTEVVAEAELVAEALLFSARTAFLAVARFHARTAVVAQVDIGRAHHRGSFLREGLLQQLLEHLRVLCLVQHLVRQLHLLLRQLLLQVDHDEPVDLEAGHFLQ